MWIFSWLQSWQLVCMGRLQCDLQWRNPNQNSGGNSATEVSGRDLSGSGGKNGVQYWRMPRFNPHLAFWSWSSHLYLMWIFSWLQSWQLVCMGWLQCDLRRRNPNKNSGGNSATESWGSDLSGSGGNKGLQYWPVPRFTSHLPFWSWSSHLY